MSSTPWYQRFLPKLFWSQQAQVQAAQLAKANVGSLQPIELPPPLTMTMSLTQALQQRRSRRRFDSRALSLDHLSTLLWACDGITGEKGGRTTPCSLNWQEVELYAMLQEGVWTYNPEAHRLEPYMQGDWREVTGTPGQGALNAPLQLVMVANQSKTESWATNVGSSVAKFFLKDWTDEAIAQLMDRSMTLDVGVKVQAISLAAAALPNIHCVVRAGFDSHVVARALSLAPYQHVLCTMSLGYAPAA